MIIFSNDLLQINCADPSSRNGDKNETDANNLNVKAKKSSAVNDGVDIVMSTSSGSLNTVFRRNSDSGDSTASGSSGLASSVSSRKSSPDQNRSTQSLNTLLQGISLQNDKFHITNGLTFYYIYTAS